MNEIAAWTEGLGNSQSPFMLMTRDRLNDGGEVVRSGQCLGQGSLGSVYKGELSVKKDLQEVAIKFTHNLSKDDAVQALISEKEAFKMLPPHENIIKCLGSRMDDQYPGLCYVVLEYMPLNLKSVLEHKHKLNTYRDLLQVLQGIARGMVHLHTRNIYHHDLKPENVLLSQSMIPKLTDFGASSIRRWQTSCSSYRRTLGYMAPEDKLSSWIPNHAEMDGKIRHQSGDIFSFGVLMWECTTGGSTEEPGDGDASVKWGGLIPMEVMCNCPEELRSLIEECLRFDASVLSTKEFGRPSSLEILQKLTYMQKTCMWVDDQLVWKKQQYSSDNYAP